MRISQSVTLWQIMAGAEIQANGWFPCIHRPYKTKGFAHRVSYFASLPLHLQPPPPIALAPYIHVLASVEFASTRPIFQWSHGAALISPSSTWRALSAMVFSTRGPPPRSGGCPAMRTRRRRSKATLCPSLTSTSRVDGPALELLGLGGPEERFLTRISSAGEDS